MKVLLINGSPRKDGNSFLALSEVAHELERQGIETEIAWIGTKAVRGCIACYTCRDKGENRCAFNDDIANEIAQKAVTADGFVVASPVYYGLPTGQVVALLQRLMCSAGALFKFKPVANIAVCRRGGATASIEALNMPWMMMNCPIVTSTYWNIVYGADKGEALQDKEGLQVMRMLARNMARILRGFSTNEPPQLDPQTKTSFIR